MDEQSLSRTQKWVIGFSAILFFVGLATAFFFLARHDKAVSDDVRPGPAAVVAPQSLPDELDQPMAVQAPVETTSVSPSTPGTVSDKVEAERMLQEMEDDFRSLDAETSAQ
jgi:hypothetical protein